MAVSYSVVLPCVRCGRQCHPNRLSINKMGEIFLEAPCPDCSIVNVKASTFEELVDNLRSEITVKAEDDLAKMLVVHRVM